MLVNNNIHCGVDTARPISPPIYRSQRTGIPGEWPRIRPLYGAQARIYCVVRSKLTAPFSQLIELGGNCGTNDYWLELGLWLRLLANFKQSRTSGVSNPQSNRVTSG